MSVKSSGSPASGGGSPSMNTTRSAIPSNATEYKASCWLVSMSSDTSLSTGR
ncbi:hypothetical protein D3C73_1606030 [compost metagenome]